MGDLPWGGATNSMKSLRRFVMANSEGFDLAGRCRLLLIGHGRHGKDSAGDILRDRYGLRSVSSSEFAAQKAVFP
jgi:hypothetical protein